MNFLIFGAGAVGSVVAVYLRGAGHGVTLLGRAPPMEAVRRGGLRLRGIWGERHATGFQTVTRVEELPADPAAFDWVLLTVKAIDTGHAAESLRRFPSLAPIVSLQNGLGNLETLVEGFGPARVLGGRVIYGAALEPGVVTVTVSADDVLVGESDPARGIERAGQLAALFSDAGLKTRAVADIHPPLWAKVMFNCALNPLATLLDCPYGDLLKTEPSRRLMRAIVSECYAVASARGVRLEPADAEAYVRLLFERLIPPTAAHRPSMLQAVRAGKPTEIDALNGRIAQWGAELGVAAPVNAVLAELIRARSGDARL